MESYYVKNLVSFRCGWSCNCAYFWFSYYREYVPWKNPIIYLFFIIGFSYLTSFVYLYQKSSSLKFQRLTHITNIIAYFSTGIFLLLKTQETHQVFNVIFGILAFICFAMFLYSLSYSFMISGLLIDKESFDIEEGPEWFGKMEQKLGQEKMSLFFRRVMSLAY